MNPLIHHKAFSALTPSSPTAQVPANQAPQQAQKYLHANGLEYYIYHDPSEPIVCLQAVVKTGSANEHPSNAGYSHFIEHLAFKSSKHFGFNEISNTISSLGGWLNAYTDFDSTCYYLLLPSEHLEVGLQVLGELLIHASFTSEDVETEKDIIFEEMEQYQDDPEADFLEFIQLNHYHRCPLAHSIIGNIQSIKSATQTKLKRFYRKRYRPENSFLVISGAAEPELVHGYIDRNFGSWKASEALPKTRQNKWLEPEISKHRFLWQKAEQKLFALVLPELSELNILADPLLFAIRYLAIGRSSRLHKILVEEKKLCSNVRVSSLCGLMSGASVVSFLVLKESAIPQIASIIRREYCALWHDGIAPDEFELIRKDIIHGWLFGFEARENIANYIVAEALLGDFKRLYDYGQRINDITAQDVEKAIKTYWKPQNLSLYYRGPENIELKAELIPGHPDYLLTKNKTRKLPVNTTMDLNIFELQSDLAPKPQIAQMPNTFSQVAPNYWRGTLANGLHFTFKQIHSNPVSGFALCTPVSQLWEAKQQRGLNYFLSTLLLYQSERYSHQSIMDFSRRLGMNIRVVHSLDNTSFKGKCFTDDLRLSLDLLAELLTNIKLDSKYLLTLKSAALNSLRREKDYPPGYGYLKWLRSIFRNSDQLERSSGNISQIQQIKLPQLDAWFKDHYHARNFHLAISSSLDPHELWEIVNRCFASMNTGSANQYEFQPLCQTKQHNKTSLGANGQSVIHTGSRSCPAQDKTQTTAAHLLSQIIGGDSNSRFFDIVREKYALAYQTGMDLVNVENFGYWAAYAFCNPKESKLCLELMQEIIADIHHHGVLAKELEIAKNYLIGMHRFDAESVSYQASSLAVLSALGYPIEHHLHRSQRIQAIKLDDLNSYAERWLNPNQLYTHILK